MNLFKTLAIISIALTVGCASIQPVRSSGEANYEGGKGEEMSPEATADLRAKVEALEKKIQELSGKLESIEHGSEATSYRKVASPGSSASSEGLAVSSMGESSDKIKQLFDQQRFEEAAAQLEQLLKQGDHPIYLYYLGEAHFQMEKYSQAIFDFEDLKKRHPRFEKNPQACLRQSEAFLKLGQPTDAILFYQEVLREYPHSEEAKIAKSKLTTLKN